MLELEEADPHKQNGVFEKAASLFGEISSLCKEIKMIHLRSIFF
ncbi:MAG: hypothetical protein ACFE8N_15120 [Promethearchaeota archaeon]